MEGYVGYLCSECFDNFHPDTLDFQCKLCPDVWYQVFGLVVYTGLVLLVPLACDLLGFDWRAAVYMRIVFSFLQTQVWSSSPRPLPRRGRV